MNKIDSGKWRDLGARDKFQLVNGTVLIAAAIVLYYISFIITLTVGVGVISAGATLLGTGLALFGIGSYFKNQLVNFESNLEKQVDERIEKRLKREKEEENEDEQE